MSHFSPKQKPRGKQVKALPPVTTFNVRIQRLYLCTFKFTSRCNVHVISREVNKYTTTTIQTIYKKSYIKIQFWGFENKILGHFLLPDMTKLFKMNQTGFFLLC